MGDSWKGVIDPLGRSVKFVEAARQGTYEVQGQIFRHAARFCNVKLMKDRDFEYSKYNLSKYFAKVFRNVLFQSRGGHEIDSPTF